MADDGNGDMPETPLQRYALKHRDQFLVADALGDIVCAADGLFAEDTRILSRYVLRIGAIAPSLLQSGLSHDNVLFRAHLTNRQLPELGGHRTPEGVIHLERTRLLWDARVFERITLTNYGAIPVFVPLQFAFAADFADIFEVRGATRVRRGRFAAPKLGESSVLLEYEGLDGVKRSCALAFSVCPSLVSADLADLPVALADHARVQLYIEIGPTLPPDPPGRERYRLAAARARLAMRAKRRGGARVDGSGQPFRIWLGKALADLALLTDDHPTGPYPCAGIPWFSTPFGRDGIITALQMLWLNPALARGVLAFHATHQADGYSAFQDAAPGKILHELRKGEMAALGEVPFRRYYGGVDGTPLFVVLAGAYAQQTADMAFIDRIWPALEAAMAWIEGDGDANRDGFVDYARQRQTGLSNQGWKDSHDSVFHADGRLATGPIALVEVQGYAYAARRAMAWLADRRGANADAQRWRDDARELRSAVEARFWMPDAGFYALALDGDGIPCRVCCSNAGHLLYARLPSVRRARLVIERLLTASFDDGWGLRTLARGEARFNPMSYHNGSIWPHDTALCAAGMASYGHKRAAARLLSTLFTAAAFFESRLPELYCGFGRRRGEPPVGYPVACLPQAWSSGAAFMLLQACLGVSIDGVSRIVRVDRPELPVELDRLPIRGLEVADARIDIVFERVGDRTVVTPVGSVPESVQILIRA